MQPLNKPNSLKRVAMATMIGTAIEYFDNYIYTMAAVCKRANLFTQNSIFICIEQKNKLMQIKMQLYKITLRQI